MAVPAAFQENTKKELTKVFKRLVKTITPEELGVYNTWDEKGVQEYANALVTYLDSKPYILATERINNVRIDWTRVRQEDKEWVIITIGDLVKALRRDAKSKMLITDKLVNLNKAWVDWNTTDCVFIAILRTMGWKLRCPSPKKFNGEDAQLVKLEQELEEKLATALQIRKKIVNDETLIYIIEDCLKWTRIDEIKCISHLPANTKPGKAYLITYCTNAQSDAWHTVYCERHGNKFEVYDRQAMRKSAKNQDLPGLGTTECTMWEVNTSSDFLTTIRAKIDLDSYIKTATEKGWFEK